ncbi:ARO1-like protein, partial [Trifolium medium]|nr:ARO1-like protein [Trifolium medium]
GDISGSNDVKKESEDEVKIRMNHPLGDRSTNQMHKVVTSTMAKHAASANSNKNQKTNESGEGRELEDAESKAHMKAMAAKALRYLAKGNSGICRSITESRALLCFAILLEKGPEEVKYNSALALKEITAVAEEDPELRRSA